jgi:formylglycine-generating enzyme required for sulfatase activity
MDGSKFRSRYSLLCDSLVELLHIEVMGTGPEDAGVAPVPEVVTPAAHSKVDAESDNGQLRCPVCMNVIDSSNKLLICQECNARFCQACESWFRGERKRSEKPLCKECFTAEQERLERERREREEAERKKQQEEERRRKEAVESEKQKSGNSIGMEFVKIPAGEFQMGSEEHSCGNPVHRVNIPEAFYMGKYPVTQKQWKAVMGNNPSHFKGDDRPVEYVSWYDVLGFVEKLNELEGTDKYRLPSEAEWEYACRAGTTTRYSFGDSEAKLRKYGWYDGNSRRETHPVGKKKPNPWGLYDIHGNVWEWCQDKWRL